MRNERRADFEEFLEARWSSLFRTAYLLTGDRHLAEDLLQDCLAASWPRWSSIQPGREEAYVRRAMANRATRVWRRRGRETVVEHLPEGVGTGGLDDSEARLDLWPHIQRLPARQRAVIVLRFFCDLSEADTADTLGCSTGTVKSQQHRALRTLRAGLPEDRVPVLVTAIQEGS